MATRREFSSPGTVPVQGTARVLTKKLSRGQDGDVVSVYAVVSCSHSLNKKSKQRFNFERNVKKGERCYDKYLRPKKPHPGQLLEFFIVIVIKIVCFAVEMTLQSSRSNCFASLLSFIPKADRVAFLGLNSITNQPYFKYTLKAYLLVI